MENSPIVLRISDWILSGIGRTEILQLIKADPSYEDYSNADCDALIAQSKQVLSTVSVSPKDITAIHVSKYEELYFYFHSIQFTDGMNKALRGKEKLLGMIGGSKTVVNKTTTVNINRDTKYITDLLSPIEKLRINELMQKCTPKLPLQIAQDTQADEIVSKTIEAVIK